MAEVVDICAGDIPAKPDAARPAAHVEAYEADNHVSADGFQTFDRDPEIRACIEHIGEELSDSLGPLVDAFDRPIRAAMDALAAGRREGWSAVAA